MQPEPESEELNDYPGGPHNLTVLTKYRVHVARLAVDGVVKHYTFYLMKIEFLCCFNDCKLLLIFVMYYSDYCETDVSFLLLVFVVALQFKMCNP